MRRAVSGSRLRVLPYPLPVRSRRQSTGVDRGDPDPVVVDKDIPEHDRLHLFPGQLVRCDSVNLWSGILKVESTNTQKSGIIKQTRKEKEEMATYSKEFKAEALRLSDEIGVKKAAEQLGIPYFTLADWRSSRKEKQRKTSEMSEEDFVRRNRELEKENAELRQANEI